VIYQHVQELDQLEVVTSVSASFAKVGRGHPVVATYSGGSEIESSAAGRSGT
jgi:hypothetical protein